MKRINNLSAQHLYFVFGFYIVFNSSFCKWFHQFYIVDQPSTSYCVENSSIDSCMGMFLCKAWTICNWLKFITTPQTASPIPPHPYQSRKIVTNKNNNICLMKIHYRKFDICMISIQSVAKDEEKKWWIQI